MTTRRSMPYVLLAFVGVLLALYFVRTVYPLCTSDCYTYHKFVVETGQAGSPYRYRILSAAIVELIARAIPGDPVAANAGATTIVHAIAFVLLLQLLYTWLTRWMNADRAFAASLLFAVIVPLGFQPYYFISVFTPVEVVIVLACLLLFQRRNISTVLVALIVFIATLNRETGGLIVIAAYVAITGRWRVAGMLCAGYVATLIGLRVVLGWAAHIITIGEVFSENTTTWLGYGLLHNAFILPLWVYAAVRVRHAPVQLQRLALIVLVVYMPFIVVFGQWHETRLLWVPLTLLLPIAFGGDAHDRGDLSVHVGCADGNRADVSSGDRHPGHVGRVDDAAPEHLEQRA